MKPIYLILFTTLLSCKESSEDRASLSKDDLGNWGEIEFQMSYSNGLPKSDWVTKTEDVFRDVPIAVFVSKFPNSYGYTFDLIIYYKVDHENKSSTEWRQCLRFAARSYSDLRLEFDQDADRLIIHGTFPNDGHEEKILTRENFHDAFTYYIPGHG